MISCNLKGGLGNQMFQISTTLSLSYENNVKCCFDFNKSKTILQGNPSSYYKNNVFKKLCNKEINLTPTYVEPFFHYKKITFTSDMILDGYFQSEKYFKKYRDKILDIFDCTNEIKEKLFSKYPILNDENTCSLHIRRGDYIKLNEYHVVLDLDYYKNAIEIIGDKNFFIVSDDISWCKTNLNFIDNVIFCENEFDFEDLYLMSFCKNNIISNSSFSWWGGWLNKNNSKKVIAPKKWFGTKNSHLITEDLYCENWIII